ncbi:MAG: DUF4845 domain-containing protein [Hydrogenophilaceae bacterium]|nr:DUF4845 domain-containing protein [Hydrogenophilaceae bacterium]
MSKQNGFSLIGMLLLAIVVIFASVMALRVVPTYIEYFTIKKMVEETMAQPSLDNVSDAEIREKFGKQLSINNITRVTSRDLLIERSSQGVVAKLSYSVRQPLMGQASLCLDFETQAGGKAGQ